MKQDKNQFSSSRWTKATFAGWCLSIIAILVLSGLFDGIGIENLQFYLGIGMALGTGYMQWRVLRRTHGISSKWIWYSVIGMGAPFLLFDLLKLFAGLQLGANYIKYSLCIASVLSGILQFLVLRKHANKAGLWVVASILGWVAATGTVLIIDYTRGIANNLAAFFINLSLILTGGLVLGLITGWFLVYILGSNAQREPTEDTSYIRG